VKAQQIILLIVDLAARRAGTDSRGAVSRDRHRLVEQRGGRYEPWLSSGWRRLWWRAYLARVRLRRYSSAGPGCSVGGAGHHRA